MRDPSLENSFSVRVIAWGVIGVVAAKRRFASIALKILRSPPCPDDLKAFLEHMAEASFDHAAAEGKVVGQVPGMIELVAMIAQVAPGGADRGILSLLPGLELQGQFADHFIALALSRQHFCVCASGGEAATWVQGDERYPSASTPS